MILPTEPIGSIPRPPELIEAVERQGFDHPANAQLYDQAVQDTIREFEATGSPVITDGEQCKYQNFWTYCIHGLENMEPDGFKIPFEAGQVRRMPRLVEGPFRYKRYADSYLEVAQRYATVGVKQAVVSPSALSLLYPPQEIGGYPREQFIRDLMLEHETEVKNCLRKGAHAVQLDFTEGRLALKIDPSGELLASFIDLNNLALSKFSDREREKIGVHTCAGGDQDSTHSADVDYAELLTSLFKLNVGNFYLSLASERDQERILKIIRACIKPNHRVFIGVTSPTSPRVESPKEVRDLILKSSEFIAPEQLGTTDDCGFSPFSDDTSASRSKAFAKIRARVQGTTLASRELGLSP